MLLRKITTSQIFLAFKNYKTALLAALFFGCLAPGAKFFSQSIPPQSLAGIFYFSAGLGLLCLLLIQNNLKISFQQFQRKDRKWFFLSALFGGLLGPVFLTYGLINISASKASLFLNLEAVLTALIAWFFFKEHFGVRVVWGTILIVASCLVLSWSSLLHKTQDSFLGFLLIFAACLAWAIDNNVTRKLSHLNSVFIACLKGLVAGSFNLFLAYIIGENLALDTNLLAAGVLGFLGIGISLIAFIVSLGKIGTARTSAVFSTSPFVGVFLSILLFKEAVTWSFAFALILMITGVYLHFTEDHSHEHTHEEIEHTHEHVHDNHHQHEHQGSHTHLHRHEAISHNHSHLPDLHHQHIHDNNNNTKS